MNEQTRTFNEQIKDIWSNVSEAFAKRDNQNVQYQSEISDLKIKNQALTKELAAVKMSLS